MKLQPAILLLGVKSYQPATIELIRQHYPQLEPLSLTGNLQEIIEQIPEKLTIVAAINRGDDQIETHSRLVDHFSILGPSFAAVKHFRSKAALDQLMLKHDLGQYRPKTQLAQLDNLRQRLNTVDFPVIIKPFQGAKSRGVYKLTKLSDYTDDIQQELEQHFTDEPSLKGKAERLMLIEDFIDGRQTTVTAYLDDKGKIHNLGVVDVYDGYDLGQDHRQLVYRTTDTKLAPNGQEELVLLLQKLAQITGLKSTFIHPDFIINQQEIKLIELNARMGGLRNEMAQYAYGLNLDLFTLQLALGETPNDAKLKNHSCTGSDIWSTNSGVVKQLQLFEHEKIVEKKISLKEGDQYLAPPKGNQQLIRFYVETASTGSLAIAQEIQQKSQIVIE